MLQASAAVACRQLGFQDGVFRDVENTPASLEIAPPWLGRLECQNLNETLADCGVTFGNTVNCGPTQQLFCVNELSAKNPRPTASLRPFNLMQCATNQHSSFMPLVVHVPGLSFLFMADSLTSG